MNSVYTIISGGPPFGTAPTHQADGRIFFCEPHSFPSPVCDIVGDVLSKASRCESWVQSEFMTNDTRS